MTEINIETEMTSDRTGRKTLPLYRTIRSFSHCNQNPMDEQPCRPLSSSKFADCQCLQIYQFNSFTYNLLQVRNVRWRKMGKMQDVR